MCLFSLEGKKPSTVLEKLLRTLITGEKPDGIPIGKNISANLVGSMKTAYFQASSPSNMGQNRCSL